MRTKQKTVRLTHLDLNKIGRYFERPTIREFIEATLQASESSPYLRQKIIEQIQKNRDLKDLIKKNKDTTFKIASEILKDEKKNAV